MREGKYKKIVEWKIGEEGLERKLRV